jgi:hypothetical protein
MCALPAGPCRSLSCGSAAVLPRGGHAGSACYGYQLGIADEDHGGHVAAETSWNPWLSPSHHNSAKAHPVGPVPPPVTCAPPAVTYALPPATCCRLRLPAARLRLPAARLRLPAARLRFLTSPSGITIGSRTPPGRPARWHIEPAIAGSPAHRAGWTRWPDAPTARSANRCERDRIGH